MSVNVQEGEREVYGCPRSLTEHSHGQWPNPSPHPHEEGERRWESQYERSNDMRVKVFSTLLPFSIPSAEKQ